MNNKSKSMEAAADIAALLRARNCVLWVVTKEEARVERYLFQAAQSANYLTRFWDVAAGCTDLSGEVAVSGLNDIGDMLALISRRARSDSQERCVWVLRDLPVWLQPPVGTLTQRQLRNLARELPGIPPANAQAIIILSPEGTVPAELANHVTVIEWPLPDRSEIADILDIAIKSGGDKVEAINGQRDAAIDAAVGLSEEEAKACYSRSLVQLRRIDPGVVAREKKRVIAREKVLEWVDPLPGGLEAVGGLDSLKSWLLGRGAAYSPRARAYGLPSPRGAMLVGVQGCGKSMAVKAIATHWQSPCLRLDLGALKGKFVGQSEANLRNCIKVIEACGRVVVWIDEIEKALAGATQGAADGGVSADALGTILNWMQERTSEAFVVATSNDIEQLPPELLRKGRFDEIFFVDLPTEVERVAVLRSALKTHGREQLVIDHDVVAAKTQGFSGAEIAALVPDALFAAFSDGERAITTDDLLTAAASTVPLSETAKAKIAKLRDWSVGKTRPATSAAAKQVAVKRPQLDIS